MTQRTSTLEGMASPHGFVDLCVELLSGNAPAGGPPTVQARRMFGGHGLYVDGLFVAIISGEQLYLKTDPETRAEFEAAGCQAFRYAKAGGETAVMSYWSAPEQAMDSPDAMAPWLRLARASALRAAAAKAVAPARKPRASTAQTGAVKPGKPPGATAKPSAKPSAKPPTKPRG